jgi:hypothetical protein
VKRSYWVIERYLGGGRFEYLGKVLAHHHPAAMLKAFEKFKVKDNAQQRLIRARPKNRNMEANHGASISEKTSSTSVAAKGTGDPDASRVGVDGSGPSKDHYPKLYPR